MHIEVTIPFDYLESVIRVINSVTGKRSIRVRRKTARTCAIVYPCLGDQTGEIVEIYTSLGRNLHKNFAVTAVQ